MPHLPGEGEDLRPWTPLRAQLDKTPCAVQDDQGDVRQRLYIVDQRGFAPEPLLRRKGRPRLGIAAGAVQGGDQGRLLAADEGPGAGADLQIEGETLLQNVFPQQFFSPGLTDRLPAAMHGDGVLGADIDIAAAGASGVACDEHPLDDAVRITLQNIAIHEGAGVALIGVADDKFFIGGRLPDQLPFAPRGEPAAAAPAQP